MRKSSHNDDAMDMADWDARLRSRNCTAEDRKAFMKWYGQSAQNRSDFDSLTNLLELIREMRDEPELRSMQEWAADSGDTEKSGAWPVRVLLGAVAATAAAIAIVLVVLLQIDLDAPSAVSAPVYATAVGERSTVTFADGTLAHLNTSTNLELEFTAQERVVKLVSGQAMFDVAQDMTRPFAVIAGDRRIVAVGTIFDVRMFGDTVAITLLEGRVEVSAARGAGSAEPPIPIRMSAGERLTASIRAESASSPPLVENTDTQRATIWREGRVFFDNTKLSDAIAEMNRYSLVKIKLEQKSLNDIPVSGMFRTGQQGSFVETLESYFPLEAVEADENLIVLREE